MSYKKTCWYTFITPMQIGELISGTDAARLSLIRKFATSLGIAFQIQDDLLNLLADEGRYGKEKQVPTDGGEADARPSSHDANGQRGGPIRCSSYLHGPRTDRRRETSSSYTA